MGQSKRKIFGCKTKQILLKKSEQNLYFCDLKMVHIDGTSICRGSLADF